MGPKHRVIIDTDPGVDDTLALLLALSANPDDLQLDLISVTYGNVEVESCVRNVVSIFHHVEKEMAWRRSVGRPEGFELLKKMKPLVAVGADSPLAEQKRMADYFHGRDGLGGIYETHPHLSPAETWKHLFKLDKATSDPEELAMAEELQTTDTLFTPSKRPAHEEILRLLKENEPDTFTIVAIGPLTNIAIAAAADPETFLRVKELVVMGGAINFEGNVGALPLPPQPPLHNPKFPCPPFKLIKQPPNVLRTALNLRNQITPVAEFNTYADSVAAARVYALTSLFPWTTMPPTPPLPPQVDQAATDAPPVHLSAYPKKLSRQLKVSLFPLDITNHHWLRAGTFRAVMAEPSLEGSPLAAFMTAFLTSTFRKMESLHHGHEGDNVGLSLHDPLCIWYLLNKDHSAHAVSLSEPRDIRVETSGQWTRGMYVVDHRDRKKMSAPNSDEPVEVVGDAGLWLDERAGNRIRVAVESGGIHVFGEQLIRRILDV
ncbi:uncharacterized protein PV09_02559 [Verruconis gallopava]|uniref:Inosine/uridine-preferring nucleoside hydrolase domain-containing protein n=1 Tax=Verruconis gallopava TaxID=253628 RepID=A0A0D2AIZ9_9PEZI|nr:uncharacterized protein PV09_02559 [Verruconis gallopava]KIW06883.1 hypothetical protein PV09_02559 [Verruconis gallopava]